jgi:hypothetical protein
VDSAETEGFAEPWPRCHGRSREIMVKVGRRLARLGPTRTLTFTAVSRFNGQLHARFVRGNARPVSSSYSSDAVQCAVVVVGSSVTLLHHNPHGATPSTRNGARQRLEMQLGVFDVRACPSRR